MEGAWSQLSKLPQKWCWSWVLIGWGIDNLVNEVKRDFLLREYGQNSRPVLPNGSTIQTMYGSQMKQSFKKAGEIGCNNIFYLIQQILSIIVEKLTNIFKLLMRYFAFLFHTKSSKSGVYLRWQSGLIQTIIFQVVNSHLCLVATVFDSTGINDRGKLWNTKLLNKQSSLIWLEQAVCEWLVGDEGDAVRHQSMKILDASFGESQLNHEALQEPLMPLRDFM